MKTLNTKDIEKLENTSVASALNYALVPTTDINFAEINLPGGGAGDCPALSCVQDSNCHECSECSTNSQCEHGSQCDNGSQCTDDSQCGEESQCEEDSDCNFDSTEGAVLAKTDDLVALLRAAVAAQ